MSVVLRSIVCAFINMNIKMIYSVYAIYVLARNITSNMYFIYAQGKVTKIRIYIYIYSVILL